MSFLLGKKKLQITIPKGWHEVSFDNAIKLKEEDLTPVQILSLLSGVSEEKIKNSTDLTTIYYLANSVLFLNSWPLKKEPEFPKQVLGHKLPWVSYYDKFDLGGCNVEQVADMQAFITNQHKEIGQDNLTDLDVVKMFPAICAIYLQPIIHSETYDYDKAILYSRVIKSTLDFKTVYNMGAFFLMKLQGLINGSDKELQKQNTLRMRFKRAYWNLVQRLVSILP